jgi:PAS domain S-box-containing protein
MDRNAYLMTSDSKGFLQTFSTEASQLFGWLPEEVIGRRKVSTFHKRETLAEILPRLMKEATEQGAFQAEAMMRRKDGSEFPARLFVEALYEEGEMVGFGIRVAAL